MASPTRYTGLEKLDFSIDSKELMLKIADRLLQFNVSMFEGATDSEINNFEDQHQIKFSAEFNLYLKLINGFYDNGGWLSKLNPLKELKKVKEYDWFINTKFVNNAGEELENEYLTEIWDSYYVLGDIMIDSHQWAIKLSGDGKQKEIIIEMDYHQPVAENIVDFLCKYVNDDPFNLIA